jgi:hypothetical protein
MESKDKDINMIFKPQAGKKDRLWWRKRGCQ